MSPLLRLIRPHRGLREASYRTANESKNVTVETRRDSISMKTIASLTMIYLPSTFVATIFSTDFFSFGIEGTGKLNVRSDIWKFIVVAAISTTLAILIWVYLNRHGVPHMFKWAERNTEKIDDAKDQSPPPARIMLYLPQTPGDRAHSTALDVISISGKRSSADIDSQQIYRRSISPISKLTSVAMPGKTLYAARKSV